MLIRLSEHLTVVKALLKPHQGIVVDNNDPNKLGRVKCTIPGIMEAPKADLPWIMSELDPTRFNVPEIGNILKIEFPFNDIYSPVFTGYWHSTWNHNTNFDADYPNTFGVVKQGFKLLYNKLKKIGDLVHPSGTTGQLKGDGSLLLTIVKDLIFTITGQLTLTTNGAAKFVGKGSTEIGDAGSATMVKGTSVLLAGGGAAVALLGSQVVSTGNLGAPAIGTVIEGSSKVFAPK